MERRQAISFVYRRRARWRRFVQNANNNNNNKGLETEGFGQPTTTAIQTFVFLSIFISPHLQQQQQYKLLFFYFPSSSLLISNKLRRLER
jgi:hypothetical protein